jgi:hypothetical protein
MTRAAPGCMRDRVMRVALGAAFSCTIASGIGTTA